MIKIYPSKISGEVRIPSSKSVAHRELIAGFLSGQPFSIFGSFTSSDIDTTMHCLDSLGGCFEVNDDHTSISLVGYKDINKPLLDARDSGSTLRFLLPVVSALGVECSMIGTERLSLRPIGELLSVLTANGGNYSSNRLPLKVGGILHGGDYQIDAGISSQFITGLLFALPLLKENSRIIYKNPLVSSNYVDITLECLLRHGIQVKKESYGFNIKGNQSYISQKSLEIEGDWSSACFMACLGAVSGKVLLTGLNHNSTQGDRIIVEFLKRIGAKVEYTSKGLCIQKDRIRPIEIDAENYPDIVPVLAATLAFADGKSIIHGVDRLRIKESDRIAEIIELLSCFGINAEYSDDTLVIYGGYVTGGVYHSPNDHRMAMSFALLAIGGNGESVIDGEECVKKSYANFFEELKKLGGKYECL